MGEKEKLKIFTIPATWTMYGTYEIEAKTIEEAIEMAKNKENLPNDPSYIESSFFIDEYDAEEENR